MILEASLALAEGGRVVVATPIVNDGRHVVVKHLVKHHGLDEEGRHPGLVKGRMNPNQALLGQVGAELERALPAFRLNAFSPCDAHVERASEMASREIVDDGAQVVMTALGSELTLGRTGGDETSPVFFDEAVDLGRRGLPTATKVVGYGRKDVLIGREEHVVEPNLEPSALRGGGEHRASVVGDDEADGLAETTRELSTPVGGAGVGSIEIVLRTLVFGSLHDRLRFAGKLEGKLQHLGFQLEAHPILVNRAFGEAIGTLES